MDMSPLLVSNQVSMRKADIPETMVNLAITDGSHVDDISGFLNNRDVFRMLGKAYSIGYTADFGIYLHDGTPIVTIHPNHDMTVNWDIVRVSDKEEWFA